MRAKGHGLGGFERDLATEGGDDLAAEALEDKGARARNGGTRLFMCQATGARKFKSYAPIPKPESRVSHGSAGAT